MDISNFEHHKLSEELVNVMSAQTQNPNKEFFRILVAYYWSYVASNMQAKIKGFGTSEIPLNLYAVNLAPSGTGKGFSQRLMEETILKGFLTTFLEETVPVASQNKLHQLAAKRAVKNNSDQDKEMSTLEKEYDRLGAFVDSFSEASSTAAIKQFRHKILLSDVGAINLIIDEIGANLVGQTESLNAFLELYDQGTIKEKLTKSTNDNKRAEVINGKTPCNMLLFGTQSKLLDGGTTEKAFYDFLEMGYARRCFFAYVQNSDRKKNITVEDLYKTMTSQMSDRKVVQLADHVASLADITFMHQTVNIKEDEVKLILEYRLWCEDRASELKEHQAILKSEMENRHFKVLKLAGTYAFLEKEIEIKPKHIEASIRLAEDSGEALLRLNSPERNYVKLAKFLASNNGYEYTLSDLDADLPFFSGSKTGKDEMITMAIAWGYSNNVVIKKRFDSGILFIRGETLEETNLDEIIVSYTRNTDMTTGYLNQKVPFDKFDKVATTQGVHWLNHTLEGGYRKEHNVIQGFNTIVIDVDEGTYLTMVQEMFKNYNYLIYTTKSHGIDNQERFRIVIPTNYVLNFDVDDYKSFYNSFVNTLPFPVDPTGNQRSKKWLANPNAQVITNKGSNFNILPFIPRTTKNAEREANEKSLKNVGKIEQWFLNNIGEGNRNNQIYNFASMLMSSGKSFDEMKELVESLNSKIDQPLTNDELNQTIFPSIQKKFM